MLKPFFTYYGGKWRVARKYPAPRHGRIIEPFAGSAGYALRYPEKGVLLIDKDEVIVQTWSYLLRVHEQEILSLPLRIGKDESVDDLPVCEEARILIGWWLNKGSNGPRKRPSTWMRSKIRPNSFWGEVIRNRVATQLASIRHWEVKHGDYTDAPDLEASWFIDPPYAGGGGGKHYHHNNQGIDYSALGRWCKERRGQAIVCEREGAEWLPFQPFAVIKANASSRGGKRSREAVWCSV